MSAENLATPEQSIPTERLTRLADGCWLPLGAVTSVIAFAGEGRFKEKPHVVLKTATDTLSWDFETVELAQKFANRIAEMCNGRG